MVSLSSLCIGEKFKIKEDEYIVFGINGINFGSYVIKNLKTGQELRKTFSQACALKVEKII